jgi:hypothetical protein
LPSTACSPRRMLIRDPQPTSRQGGVPPTAGSVALICAGTSARSSSAARQLGRASSTARTAAAHDSPACRTSTRCARDSQHWRRRALRDARWTRRSRVLRAVLDGRWYRTPEGRAFAATTGTRGLAASTSVPTRRLACTIVYLGPFAARVMIRHAMAGQCMPYVWSTSNW